jgi:hypothetical protein
MATEINLPAIQRGDTIPYSFNWKAGETPIDMRGKTLIMSFKKAAQQEDYEADLTKVVVLAVDDAAAEVGDVSFRLERSETALLTAGIDYRYAIRVIEDSLPEPVETTFMYGTIQVEDA